MSYKITNTTKVNSIMDVFKVLAGGMSKICNKPVPTNPDRELLFEIKMPFLCPDGTKKQVYRIFTNGEIEGFPKSDKDIMVQEVEERKK